MPFFESLPPDAGPPNLFARYPDVYGPWSTMSQALMNGPSPLSAGERELILAYAAGLAGCSFVSVAHSEVATAWGLPAGLVERLLQDPQADTPLPARWTPLLAFVRKLVATPDALGQADADAVFAADWGEQALHDAIAVAARAAFMHRLVAGHGFTPLSREVAAKHARKRVERGYVNLYPAFRQGGKPMG